MFNNTIAGVPVGLIEAPTGVLIPCEQCFVVEAEYAVGISDHKLVCSDCLGWGDSRRWWNLEPRQELGHRVDMTSTGEEVFTYWSTR